MSQQLLKILPLNDAPSEIRNELILNAFMGGGSDILGFVTGKRLAESAQSLADERDAAEQARDKAKADCDELKERVERQAALLQEAGIDPDAKPGEGGGAKPPAVNGVGKQRFAAFHTELFKGIDRNVVVEQIEGEAGAAQLDILFDGQKFFDKFMEDDESAAGLARATRAVLKGQ